MFGSILFFIFSFKEIFIFFLFYYLLLLVNWMDISLHFQPITNPIQLASQSYRKKMDEIKCKRFVFFYSQTREFSPTDGHPNLLFQPFDHSNAYTKHCRFWFLSFFFCKISFESLSSFCCSCCCCFLPFYIFVLFEFPFFVHFIFLEHERVSVNRKTY